MSPKSVQELLQICFSFLGYNSFLKLGPITNGDSIIDWLFRGRDLHKSNQTFQSFDLRVKISISYSWPSHLSLKSLDRGNEYDSTLISSKTSLFFTSLRFTDFSPTNERRNPKPQNGQRSTRFFCQSYESARQCYVSSSF